MDDTSPEPPRTISAGSGRTEKPLVSPRPGVRRRGLAQRPGLREMKEYPVTEMELWGLGGLSVLAAFFVAIATFCFGCWFTVYEGMALAPRLDAHASGFQSALEIACFTGGIMFLAAAAVVMIGGGMAVRRIIRETQHS